uniref:Secreted RxLR effector peptide protein n=1 Tax=Panagrellus redivivus TaxID=6233 RepID=A0A7E4ZT79_PANRE
MRLLAIAYFVAVICVVAGFHNKATSRVPENVNIRLPPDVLMLKLLIESRKGQDILSDASVRKFALKINKDEFLSKTNNPTFGNGLDAPLAVGFYELGADTKEPTDLQIDPISIARLVENFARNVRSFQRNDLPQLLSDALEHGKRSNYKLIGNELFLNFLKSLEIA